VGGAPAASAARLVGPAEPVVLEATRPRFVGRGGEKLDAALRQFGIDVSGQPALDVGASTGGFTDCLLQRGAASVVAVDVGYGQLDARLRADPRVDLRERTNVRSLHPADVDPPVAVAVVDVSFISLRTVLPTVLRLVASRADVVVLVKPQFEATRGEATRSRGVIDDPAIWRRALGEVAATFQALGATIMGAMVSPIAGAEGNVEFLLHASAAPGREAPGPVDLDAVVARAAREGS
jgi:23S rRNA (cytidine1920-2'-O)/16S rRNA (cytidine1409-2'-O)-methyltransferase